MVVRGSEIDTGDVIFGVVTFKPQNIETLYQINQYTIQNKISNQYINKKRKL